MFYTVDSPAQPSISGSHFLHLHHRWYSLDPERIKCMVARAASSPSIARAAKWSTTCTDMQRIQDFGRETAWQIWRFEDPMVINCEDRIDLESWPIAVFGITDIEHPCCTTKESLISTFTDQIIVYMMYSYSLVMPVISTYWLYSIIVQNIGY
jgi:hypothetical protein